jgi:erythromycin esterase
LRQLFIIIFLFALTSLHGQTLTRKAKIKQLKTNTFSINEPSFTDTSITDFSFLSPYLKDKNLFLISDGHQSGTSRLSLFKLIKYLHEKENFDLLIIESNIYNTANTFSDILKNPNYADTIANFGLIQFLGNCNENANLFAYIGQQSNTDNQLILAGLDIGFNNGSYAKRFLSKQIDSLLTSLNSPMLKSNNYARFKMLTDSLFSGYSKKLNIENKLFLQYYSDTLRNQLKFIPGLDGYWRLINDNLYSFIQSCVVKGKTSDEISRENLMLKNFNWLTQTKYPNKKVIIWASTAHLAKCNYPKCDNTEIPMGKYLHQTYSSNKLFYLNCINNSTNDKSNTKKNDLPELLHAAKIKSGVLVFDKNSSFYINPETGINYSDFFDGILYTDNIKTCTWTK